MNLLEIWLLLATLGFSLAAPLGPVNVEMMKNAININYSKSIHRLGLSTITGIGAMTGDFIVAFSALTLGGVVIETWFLNPVMKTLLFSLNVFILVYIAYGSLRTSSKKIEKSLADETSELENGNDFAKKMGKQYGTGFVLVVTSPWSYLWWASFGTVILFGDLQTVTFDLIGRVGIVFLFLSGIFLWVLLYSGSLSLIGKIPKPSILNAIVKGSAGLLLVFALIIGIDAVCSFGELIGLKIC
ncbi:MAG: LysE family translocator [Candidatus Hodarchaeales archaeon]|jgi:threonine/homoserine/homoserine lactone efflux protein